MMTSLRVIRALSALRMIALGNEQTRRLAMLARREDLADIGTTDDRLERFRPKLDRPSPARISSIRS